MHFDASELWRRISAICQHCDISPSAHDDMNRKLTSKLIKEICRSIAIEELYLWWVIKNFMLKSTKLKIPAGNFLLDSQAMIKPSKVKNPAESFHHDEPHVIGRERHLVDNHSDVAIMQEFFAKVGLSRERSRKCARKAVIRDITTPQRLYYYFKSVPDFSLLSLGDQIFNIAANVPIETVFATIVTEP